MTTRRPADIDALLREGRARRALAAAVAKGDSAGVAKAMDCLQRLEWAAALEGRAGPPVSPSQKQRWLDLYKKNRGGRGRCYKVSTAGLSVRPGAVTRRKDATPAPAAAGELQFDCVLSSKNRDRDGDVLDPMGFSIDPKMPLLYQHLVEQPIGKFIRELGRDDQAIKVRASICLDTPLGREAASLARFGSLRISHGFDPTDVEPLDESDPNGGGWLVHSLVCMELSLVSVPSNPDAQITRI